LFSSNLPDFFFYEMEEETDKPNSEAIDLSEASAFKLTPLAACDFLVLDPTLEPN